MDTFRRSRMMKAETSKETVTTITSTELRFLLRVAGPVLSISIVGSSEKLVMNRKAELRRSPAKCQHLRFEAASLEAQVVKLPHAASPAIERAKQVRCMKQGSSS